MKNFLFLLTGLISGLVNGMLGTGGGTITVPAIQRLGVDTKKSHATAIAVILPLTIVSVFFYFRQGHTDLKSAVIVSIAGAAGSVAGAKFLRKIPAAFLKMLFGAAMIIMGIRMFFR